MFETKKNFNKNIILESVQTAANEINTDYMEFYEAAIPCIGEIIAIITSIILVCIVAWIVFFT